MHYQQLGDKIVFEVAKELRGLATVVDKRNAITFGFAGVPLISSSFADEVFGKLFVRGTTSRPCRSCGDPRSAARRFLRRSSLPLRVRRSCLGSKESLAQGGKAGRQYARVHSIIRAPG